MYFLREILLLSLISFTVATIGSSIDKSHSRHTNTLLRHRPVVDESSLDDDLYTDWYGNETTVSPAPSISPSSNATTIHPSPAPSVSPTTPEPTTEEPTTSPPTTIAPTLPPTPAPTPHHRHEWWINLFKFLIKTALWGFVAILFFFAFGAVMSNRYRIYYYLRGSWYSLLRKLKWPWQSGRDGSAPSSTLNDIIFSDNDLQEGLLMRET